MKKSIFIPLLLSLPISVMGIYAPVPDFEQGQTIILSLDVGGYYDTNIFGSPGVALAQEEESFVFQISPRAKFNLSLTEQSFIEVHYDLETQVFTDRPLSDDTLYNHEFFVKYSHTITEGVDFFITEELDLVDNPASTVVTGGQADQSYDANNFGFRIDAQVNETFQISGKYQNYRVQYDRTGLNSAGTSNIAELLDRQDNTIGVEARITSSERVSWTGEIRARDVNYDNDDANGSAGVGLLGVGDGVDDAKDNDSVFYIIGVDYKMNENTDVMVHAGAQDRDRTGVATSDSSFFYGDISVVNRYAENSHVTIGAQYDVKEPDDTATFLDAEAYSIFVNFQHALSGKTFITGSVTYEDAAFNARAGFTDIDEESVRFGLGLTYNVSEQLTLLFNYDYDNKSSDTPKREEDRSRFGVQARYAFGI